MRRLRWEEAGALATMPTNFRSVCSVKGHPRDSPRWAHITPARYQNPSFRSKKLTFRELDRPFETAPKTTRGSTSTKMCLPWKNRYENIVAKFNVASSPFQARRTCSPFSLVKSYRASEASCMMGAAQPPAPLGDAPVA